MESNKREFVSMINDVQKLINRLHFWLDGIVIVLSYFLAWVLKFHTKLFPSEVGVLSFETYMFALVFVVPSYLVLYTASHLYNDKRVQRFRVEFVNVIKANVYGLLVFLTVLYVVNQPHFSRSMLFIFFILNIVIGMAVRALVYVILFSLRRSGFNIKHVLLVGYSETAKAYIERILYYREWGYEICGILDDTAKIGEQYKGIQVVGRIDELKYYLETNNFDEIGITLRIDEYSKLREIVNICEKSGVHTQFMPDYNHIIPTRPYTEDLMGMPVINIRYVPLSNTMNSLIKRVMDILISIVGIVITSPIMLGVAIVVKTTSKGPLIYKQERVGLHNERFMMYKFRSMKVQEVAEEKKAWTTKDDPRVTAVGKFIRRTSLDELPQLFNILKGDMSVVGPRPERPFFVEKFKEEIPRYMIKHQVRPGLTGWAQVNGYRGDTSIIKRIEYDLFYIENWTISFDIKIMFLTFFKGFVNKNAY